MKQQNDKNKNKNRNNDQKRKEKKWNEQIDNNLKLKFFKKYRIPFL